MKGKKILLLPPTRVQTHIFYACFCKIKGIAHCSMWGWGECRRVGNNFYLYTYRDHIATPCMAIDIGIWRKKVIKAGWVGFWGMWIKLLPLLLLSCSYSSQQVNPLETNGYNHSNLFLYLHFPVQIFPTWTSPCYKWIPVFQTWLLLLRTDHAVCLCCSLIIIIVPSIWFLSGKSRGCYDH